jgi:Na+-transporting NADH:ubiquinone oxidoreductase subunit NqrB
MWGRDARNYQILFLLLFLVLGIGTRDWTLRLDLIGVAIATCLVTQWLVVSFSSNLKLSLLHLLVKQPEHSEAPPWSFADKLSSLKSALITALGLSLLLRADHYTTILLASSLAILSKFLFQVERKHFFNPANFGIISALILTNDAWVSPGQWGDDGWYALLFAGTGGMVLRRVGRWDTTAAFLGAYAALEALRNYWLGWSWDVFFHRLTSGSLLLFALFMLTDPRSIPNARVGRLLWAGCIAGVAFILRNQFFISTAVFWALFMLSPLSVLLDCIWRSSRFNWNDTARNTANYPSIAKPLQPINSKII